MRPTRARYCGLLVRQPTNIGADETDASQDEKIHRLVFRYLWVAVLVPLLCATHASGAETQQNVLGKLRPEFVFPDLQNTPHSIAQWDGRIVVLNFWATWCLPCRAEIPLFNKLQKAYRTRGVQFIGVAVDNAEAVRKFKLSFPIDYPVLIGDLEAITLLENYGNTTGALPYTAFIRRDGKIEALASGALMADHARRTLDKMVKSAGK